MSIGQVEQWRYLIVKNEVIEQSILSWIKELEDILIEIDILTRSEHVTDEQKDVISNNAAFSKRLLEEHRAELKLVQNGMINLKKIAKELAGGDK